ncbi:MAG: plasmid mobilization protein [Trebonia sp.]
MISVRLSADEVQAIRQAAEERGVSVSAFLRATALVAARHRDSAPTTDYPVIAYADSCTRNVSNAEVTVLTGTSLQDIGQVGGTGLAMQSTTIADH